jgi:hypothetical protein
VRSNAGAVRAAVQEGTHRVEEALAVKPPNRRIQLGRRGGGVGRVFMRYFGAGCSLIHCSYSGLLRGYRTASFYPFSRGIAACVPLLPAQTVVSGKLIRSWLSFAGLVQINRRR